MTLAKKDQDRYRKLSEIEEQLGGESSPGESRRGAAAAAIGQQLLLDALGSQEAVTKAVGGRPTLGQRASGGGASPTIRVRVTPHQREAIGTLRRQLDLKTDSDLVRVALDEYMSKHLERSA